ncbi:ABC transporter substrate-binding protein [Pseudomonas sp. 21LCFQ010]|uniref:ABC transporter substrate-binding protein n=1 Tax=Pseudomonas sp. 21LCFQ010 TaxID=2957506 RepID=UPI002096E064|nr:ABC transporter substrate-binding protein [Pseudomonas sp. 21LCFQ010]MCO8163723.1 ABC transporter substrate-binding protein [Pseudomonas sp. 21LCFQ010]
MTDLTRRKLLRGAAALGAAGLLAPALAATQEPLRVWRYKGSAASFIELAGQADTPYPVQWVDIAGGNIVLEALRSGSLDYTQMSDVPPIFASLAQVPLAVVALLPGDRQDLGLVVGAGSGIAQVADLKGRSVSYVRGTNTQYYLLDLLSRHGLTLQDIKPVPMPMQEALIAFRSGHLDALVAGGISALQATEQKQGARLENASPFVGNTVIATRRDALDDPAKRAQIADFLRRERATWAWVAANPEAWAQRSSELTGISAELYLRQFRERGQPVRLAPISEPAIVSAQQVADSFFEHRLIRQRVDVRPLWRDDFKTILEA